MNLGSYLLFVDYKPPRLAVINRISDTEVEYDWHDEFGGRKRGVLVKYCPKDFADLGTYKQNRIYGYLKGASDRNEQKALFAGMVTELRARESAALIQAVVQGNFNGSSSYDTSVESLARRVPDDEFGSTYLHLAARSGTLDKIPGLNLRDPAMNLTDAQGLSVMDTWLRYKHEKAATSKASVHIESSNSAEEIGNYGAKPPAREVGTTPPIPAHSESHDQEIPRFYADKLLSSINGNTPLPAGITKYDLVKAIPGDQAKTTFIHVAAGKGELRRFSSELVTAEMMLVKDISGRTPLHRAIKRQVFDRVPLRLCTRETLSAADNKGVSVLDLLIKNDLTGLLPESLLASISSFNEPLLIQAIRSRDFKSAPFRNLDLLSSFPTAFEFDGSWYHWLGSNGHLGDVPAESLGDQVLALKDSHGRNPLHVSVAEYGMDYLPTSWKAVENFLVSDYNGRTPFHDLASLDGLGGATPELFTREVLAIKDHDDVSVADVIEDHHQTELLPEYLRWMSRKKALLKLHELLNDDFTNAEKVWNKQLHLVINQEEFNQCRTGFVRKWLQRYPDLILDDEQAAAVAEWGSHIQVTARAGSGKTRTLVARTLFHITHCRIPASSILILAFNKKAVEEIRERLSKGLSEEQMPHVLTFHALSHRIVRPQENLIYDEGDTKEGQVFSTTIQRIIDEQTRSGPFEAKLRELMEARWEANLNRIIEMGFNLPQEEFLALRVTLPRTTMDGRRVDTEAHKHIGNALLRLGIGYGYRPAIHRAAGVAYAPEFSHYHKETDQRFLIEVLGGASAQTNAARDAFWKSERSANAHLVQFAEADCLDPDAVLERVAQELTNRGIIANPMSDDELWLLLRDDVIRDFTKAVRGFVSRCQKELISPDRLDGMLPDADPELWFIIRCSNQSVRQLNVQGLQVRFWRLCSEIYKRYRQFLAESHQKDFDQLMLNAAEMIRDGRTGFKSARGNGDICQIRHLLIDEFQDFSHLFDELRKAIVARSPEANFFCVGDDWQAINKFAGSNLRYFTGFHETFEPSVRKLITRNYRSCRRIVEIGNQVMSGQGEPSIPSSKEQGNVWRMEVGGCGNLTEAEEAVVEELGDDALAILRIASDCTSRRETVAILTRTNSVSTPEGTHKLERWQDKLRSFLPEKDRLLLEVSTTHGYKGKEADTVILLDPEAYPFVHSDSIFATIFGDTLDSIENDERRLFYVGVTRPRKTLFLLSYPARYQKPRPYEILFLKGHYPPSFDINRLQSNLLCGSRIVLRLTNRNRYGQSGGTFPLKDRLKAQEYKWNEDTKVWSKFLEQGSINSPFECVQYLNARPWVRDADDIVATFAWEDQKHGFRIERGQVLPDTADSTPSGSAFMGGPKPPFPIQEPPAFAQNHGRPQTADASNPSCNGKFETNVVGMRYDGRNQNASHLKTGDELFLRREPLNRYDRNAIEVLTSEGVQIGFISRNVAFYIARALDEQGGIWIAKVASIWKLAPPQFVGYLQISFDLPPGVSIPADFDSSSQVEDNPFASTRPSSAPQAERLAPATPPASRPSDKPQLSPQAPDSDRIPWGKAQAPPAVSGGLTQAQEDGLALLGDSRLRAIIGELYRAGACPWPVIGYEGRSPTEHSTDSMLEVAWPDQKIGIYLPTHNVTSFAAQGWVILPATAVSVDMLRSILSSAISSPSEVPRSQAQVDPASVSASQSDSSERMDRAILEALTAKQREELENLLEPRLAPIIAEMYLSGCSDWPEIGYEGRDASGRCTGSMLEVAWLDFKIGIAIPENDFRSFEQAGWTILPAATASASELRNLFKARMESTTPAGAMPPTQSIANQNDNAEIPSSKDFTDRNIRIQHGQFHDEQPDDDIPF
jgi:DNA helicase-4